MGLNDGASQLANHLCQLRANHADVFNGNAVITRAHLFPRLVDQFFVQFIKLFHLSVIWSHERLGFLMIFALLLSKRISSGEHLLSHFLSESFAVTPLSPPVFSVGRVGDGIFGFVDAICQLPGFVSELVSLF